MAEQEVRMVIIVGGGCGNPSGNFAEPGTGGLLIVKCSRYIGEGLLFSSGSNGGRGIHASGGSSGGGSINLFASKVDNINVNVSGGIAVNPNEMNGGIWKRGGAGGTGTSTIGTIVGGYYTDLDV